NEGPVLAEGDGRDGPFEPAKAPDRADSLRRRRRRTREPPEAKRPVAAAADRSTPVRRDGDACELAAGVGEVVKLVPGPPVPHPHAVALRLVPAGRHDAGPVGRERDVGDPDSVTKQGGRPALLFHVPDPDRLVPAAGRKVLAVRRECDRGHAGRVPAEEVLFLAVRGVPESHGVVVAGRGDAGPVGGEGDAVGVVRVAGEREQLLALDHVPGADGWLDLGLLAPRADERPGPVLVQDRVVDGRGRDLEIADELSVGWIKDPGEPVLAPRGQHLPLAGQGHDSAARLAVVPDQLLRPNVPLPHAGGATSRSDRRASAMWTWVPCGVRTIPVTARL